MTVSALSSSASSDITAAFAQVNQISAKLRDLQDGSLLDSLTGVASGDSNSAALSAAAAGSGQSSTAASSSFADALTQAQDGGAGTAASGTPAAYGLDSGLLGAYGSSLTGGSTVGASLPAADKTLLTSDQRTFVSALSADTGLNPGVVSAWVLAEESGSAAQSRQAAGNNDWLNLGYTDSGTYGSGDSVWSDPTSAAAATAGWLKGRDTISGYGTASSGIQAILSTAGDTPQAQIGAIQNSGWASSGYPNLTSLYEQVVGA